MQKINIGVAVKHSCMVKTLFAAPVPVTPAKREASIINQPLFLTAKE